MKKSDTVILVFLKPFEAGLAKTRLAATVGDVLALEIYKQLVEHTLQQLYKLSVSADVILCYSQPASDKQHYISEFPYLIQKGDDLGSRMLHALEWAHAENYERKIIIGSDCFDLTTEILEQAINWLNAKQVVVGPAEDGGYYLIGMKEPHASLLSGIPWSTDMVFTSTVEKIEQLQLGWVALPTLSDLDEEQDLLKYPSLRNLIGL